MKLKDIDTLFEQNHEKLDKLIALTRKADITLPSTFKGIACFLSQTEPQNATENSLRAFAEKEYLLFMADANQRTQLLNFKKLLTKPTPFEEIKEKAKQLTEAGLHIHTLGIVLEETLQDSLPFNKLIKIDGQHISVSNVYTKFMGHMLAIYANDLKAFETVCEYSVLFRVMLWKEQPELWEPLFKMYTGQAEHLVKLIEKYAFPFRSSVFQSPDLLKKVIEFLQAEKIPLFEHERYTQVIALFMNRILFDSRQTPNFEVLMRNLSLSDIQAHIYYLCKTNGSNIWNFFKRNQHKDAKTGLFTPDLNERLSYFSAIKSLLILAEKYQMQHSIYADMIQRIPISCLQEFLNSSSQIEQKKIYDMLNYPFKRKVLRKKALVYAAGLSLKNKPLLWGLLQNKTITESIFLEHIQKLATHQIPEKIIAQTLIPSIDSQNKISPRIEKEFLYHFSQNSYLLQKWLDAAYPFSHPTRQKTIHALYGDKLKKNTVSGDELIWLSQNKMSLYYFDVLQDEAVSFLETMDKEQFKTFCHFDSQNILHHLCGKSDTRGLKWIYQKHPDLFLDWIQEKDSQKKTPFEKAPPQFIRKMELRLTQKGDTKFAQLFTDFLNHKGITFEQKETTQKQQSEPIKQPRPTQQKMSILRQIDKMAYETPLFQTALAQIQQTDILKSLHKTMTYMLSSDFNYQKSYADRKEIYGELRAHRIRKHRLLYYVDFARHKLVFLDLASRKECYRKWTDTTFLRQHEELAKHLLSQPAKKQETHPILLNLRATHMEHGR